MEEKNPKDITEEEKGYSTNYKSIRREIESKWPDWKVAIYNDNFAISTHAKKIMTKTKPLFSNKEE